MCREQCINIDATSKVWILEDSETKVTNLRLTSKRLSKSNSVTPVFIKGVKQIKTLNINQTKIDSRNIDFFNIKLLNKMLDGPRYTHFTISEGAREKSILIILRIKIFFIYVQ